MSNKLDNGSILLTIKSKNNLRKLFNQLTTLQKLRIIRQNKKIQNKLNISKKDYEEYCTTIIEIVPYAISILEAQSKYINIINNIDKKYIHIFFDDSKDETHVEYLTNTDNVKKIKIIIDKEIKSFFRLFSQCKCIKRFKLSYCKRKDLPSMKYMFDECSSLEEIEMDRDVDFSATDMSYMFNNCSSLKKVDMPNVRAYTVKTLNNIFQGCKSLVQLNISRLNTDQVTDMAHVFDGCSRL